MGILRADRVGGIGGVNAINGSVFFPYKTSGGYFHSHMEIMSDDFAIGTGNFTSECFYYQDGAGGHTDSGGNVVVLTGNKSGTNGIWLSHRNDGKFQANIHYASGSWNLQITSSNAFNARQWYHVALVRSGSSVKLYVDGVQEASGTSSSNLTTSMSNGAWIGSQGNTTNPSSLGSRGINGYVSNVRISNEALYTAAFTAPTTRLEKLSSTLLLCCQSPGNIFKEETGKTITLYQKEAASDSPKVSRFAPDKGEDYGTTFADNTKFDTLSYMVPPGGTTAESNRGRGLMMGGGGSSGNQWSGYTNIIDYVQIQSMGIAQDFGDLTNAPLLGSNGGAFSSTRGIQAGGFGPSSTNIINYVTIATTSNALDFGDLTNMKSGTAALSNQTRGIFAGGDPSGGGIVNSIDYITITTLGNSSTFGDLNDNTRYAIGTASPTRGIVAGGMTPTATNTIEYVTIATTGDAVNFGDMSYSGTHPFGVSNGTRGLIAGVSQEPNTNLNTIDYITIASTGNTSDFGDLTLARGQGASMTNSIRGLFGRGEYNVQSRYYTNTIDNVLIATLGDAADFGDSISATTASGGGSDSHGGIS